MLEFKTIDIADRGWINEALKKSDFRGCEYSFSNNMAWRRLFDTQICGYKDFYISCSHKDSIYFIFPAGGGHSENDYKDIFAQMKRYAAENNSPLIIGSVTNENLCIFEKLFPGQTLTGQYRRKRQHSDNQLRLSAKQ